MSSIETKATLFYSNTLTPIAKTLQLSGKELLARSHQEGASYYIDRPDTPYVVELDGASIAPSLKAHWEQEGLPQLVALLDPFLEIIGNLEDEEVSEQVSPLIYQMF